jgi:hypothetical protein
MHALVIHSLRIQLCVIRVARLLKRPCGVCHSVPQLCQVRSNYVNAVLRNSRGKSPDPWTCLVNPHLMYISCNIYLFITTELNHMWNAATPDPRALSHLVRCSFVTIVHDWPTVGANGMHAAVN